MLTADGREDGVHLGFDRDVQAVRNRAVADFGRREPGGFTVPVKITTLAPVAANSSAMARPMPLAPPVTAAICPSSVKARSASSRSVMTSSLDRPRRPEYLIAE